MATLKTITSQFQIWNDWKNSYNDFVPKFITEASTQDHWKDWDKDVFWEYFERSGAQCISSLRQGYFTKEEQRKIKENWSEIGPLLKQIALVQDHMQLDIYGQLSKTLRKYTKQNRFAATNRLIAGLQPDLLCTIVNEGKLDWMIYFLQTRIDNCSIQKGSNWYEKSNTVLNYFLSELQRKPNEIITLPWQTYDFFKSGASIQSNDMSDKSVDIEETIQVLKYKKQIILQGPPGTGKTKLAKEIASEILTKKITKTPLDTIKEFLKAHAVTDEVQKWREKREVDLKEFLSKFPVNQLLQLNLDSYCIGKSNKDNFCWWIERGLESFGRYSPSFSINYGVYFSKKEQTYKTLKRYNNPDEAINEMKLFVSQIANEEFDKDGFRKLGDGFILKILASYYPDKYVQVYKPEILEQISKLLKVDYQSHYIRLSTEIKLRIDELIKETNSSCDSRELIHYIFSKFLGGNETEVHENELTITSKPTLIQFHPSFSYEDFVRGIVADDVDGQIKYSVQNKTLAELAKKASCDIDNPYVLIIDEINRANLSSVLGELIYALEYRGEPVSSMYALEDSSEDEYEIVLPPNLYIVGTMNTADRSTGKIDYAIRRRFAFITVPARNLAEEGEANFDSDLYEQVAILFEKNCSPEFNKEDVQLGHSYFIDKSSDPENPVDMDIRWKHEIQPILLEYVKDGILFGEYDSKPIKQYIEEWEV